MNLFDDGIAVLKIAAAAGNRPAQAVLDELDFRQTRIETLHETIEALRQVCAERGELRHPEIKAAFSNVPAGWSNLFCGDFIPGVTRANAIQFAEVEG